MSKVNAFPVQVDRPYNGGMELRDYFAAKALPVAMKQLERIWDDEMGAWCWNKGDEEIVAGRAYEWADAMMKARKA